MTTAILVFAVISLFALYKTAKGSAPEIHSLEELKGRTLTVHAEAFHNLVNADNDSFLREHLSGEKYRALQKEKHRLYELYLKRIIHNSTVLIRLGDLAARDADPAIAESGTNLSNTALQLRVYAISLLIKVKMQSVLPNLGVPSMNIMHLYDGLKYRTDLLLRSKNPILAAQLTASL
jgi:hypothetical protein